MTCRSLCATLKILSAVALLQLPCAAPCVADDGFFSSLFKSAETKVAPVNNVATSIATLKENMDVRGLDFSPDGKFLAATSTSDSDAVHIWDWQAGSIVRKMKKGDHSADPTSTDPLKYSPDGRYLLACHSANENDVVIHVWDVQTGDTVHEVDAPKTVECGAIRFTPDGQQLVRVGSIGRKPNDSIFVYGTKDWRPVWSMRTLPYYPTSLALSPDGKFAAVGGNTYGTGIPQQPQIRIVDLAKHAVVRTIDAFPVGNRINSLAWHPDGKLIAAGALAGDSVKGPDLVKIFDAISGKQVAGEIAGSPGSISVLRYSPDGRYLVQSALNSGVFIWDGQHKTLLQEIRGEIASLAFTRDGHYLALGSNGKIQLWQLK